MEHDAVIEALPRQFLDAGDMLRRQVRAKLDHDTAGLQVHVEGVFGRRCRGPAAVHAHDRSDDARSEEHTSELQSLMRISYAVFCLKKKTIIRQHPKTTSHNNIHQI